METVERALHLVDDLAELTDPADYAGVVLPGLADLIGCDVVTYNEVGSTVYYRDWPTNSLDPASNGVFAHYAHQHPVINHFRATSDPRAASISDFLSTTEFHRLGLYAEFFRHVPVEHQLSVTLNDGGSPVIGMAFNRSRKAFTDVDRALLTSLRGPLLRALLRVRVRAAAPGTAPGPADRLSARERQVLHLVALGRTNVAIATSLGTSPRTVAKHLEHIYRKLGVPGRAAAVAQAGSI
jgi:DNA-binding CsgD family transcriptional regulator